MKKIWILLISLIMLTTGTLYAQEVPGNQAVMNTENDIISEFMSLDDKEKAKFVKKAETLNVLEGLLKEGCP